MNLVIDKGNTSTKLAVFDGDKMLHEERAEALTVEAIRTLQNRFNVTDIALSTVSGVDDEVLNYLNGTPKFLHFTATSHSPIKNPFPTLGSDRLAAVIGAYSLHHDKNFVVVDCGTCITYEVVIDGQYVGGNILPGVRMRLHALNEHTYLLPEVAPREFSDLYGVDTESAILAGVMGGVKHELEGFVADFQRQYGDFSIFLTGGDAKYFENQINFCNFAVENLVPLGLNYTLNHNE